MRHNQEGCTGAKRRAGQCAAAQREGLPQPNPAGSIARGGHSAPGTGPKHFPPGAARRPCHDVPRCSVLQKNWAQAALIIPLVRWLLAGARGGVAALFAARVLGGAPPLPLAGEGCSMAATRELCSLYTAPSNGCSSGWVMGFGRDWWWPQSGPWLRPGARGPYAFAAQRFQQLAAAPSTLRGSQALLAVPPGGFELLEGGVRSRTIDLAPRRGAAAPPPRAPLPRAAAAPAFLPSTSPQSSPFAGIIAAGCVVYIS